MSDMSDEERQAFCGLALGFGPPEAVAAAREEFAVRLTESFEDMKHLSLPRMFGLKPEDVSPSVYATPRERMEQERAKLTPERRKALRKKRKK